MNPDVLLIRKLMSRQNLSRAESAELMETLLRNDAQGWKLLAYSVASQTKGETVEELLGMHDALQAITGRYDLDLDGRRPMEVSSAGGSGVRKINVSTLTALVVGSPEVPIIKHSFWRVTSITGSADVVPSPKPAKASRQAVRFATATFVVGLISTLTLQVLAFTGLANDWIR